MGKLLPPWPLLALLVLALLSSCTQNLFVTKAPLAAPTALAAAPDYQYHLRKDDKVSISVWDHEELSMGSIYGHYSVNEADGKWAMVDQAGDVAVPKVGRFHIEGLTLLESQAQLEKLMGKWIVNPQVTLKVLNLEATVLGEVNVPGRQRIDKERNTLTELLGRAGDFAPYADKRHVKVLRQNATGAQTTTTEIDLTRLSSFERDNLNILPGDVVYVPSRNGKQFDRKAPTVIGVTSIISTIFIILRFAQ